MKRILILLVFLILVGNLAFGSTSAAIGDSCTTCWNQCRAEGMERQMSCLEDPNQTYETCKSNYFQYVNNCGAVFCSYGGLCQMIID